MRLTRSPQAASSTAPGIDESRCQVRVLDAVGIIATPTLELEVRPKIPTDHLLFLLGKANLAPNFLRDRAHLDRDRTLAEIVIQWFLHSLERLLEQGLARDYREVHEEIEAVRGRIAPLATASLYYRGRLSVVAEFEEFDFDTPLNRLLREAARIVLATTSFDPNLRRRAARALGRMDGIGPVLATDFAAEPDRPTQNYADPIMLAKCVIEGSGTALTPDADPVWTFLIRTPDAVEAGIRSSLRDSLPESRIDRGRQCLPIAGSTMTLNPDLVFGDDLAVGDVKYKLAATEWNRADLYEVVAFAEGLGTTRAAILGFSEPAEQTLPAVRIGDIVTDHLDWPSDEKLAPELAAARLGAKVLDWLSADTCG